MTESWLYAFVESCVRAFDDRDASLRLEVFRQENKEQSLDSLVRRWVEHRLRQTGVVYGTPLTSEKTIAFSTSRGYLQRRAVFLAILRIEAELAMEVGCAVKHCSTGTMRIIELLVCFALLCRQYKLAEKFHLLISEVVESSQSKTTTKQLLGLCAKLAKKLPDQAYIAGNPLLGLPIHNSFNYVDAKTLGRVAVCYFERGEINRKAIERVLDFGNREKELLLRAMLGLTLADRNLGKGSLKVVSGQIKSATLPAKVRRSLLRLIRKDVTASSVAAAVQDTRTSDFLLEQVVLGAMLDGHYSERESVYIGALAGQLGVSTQKLAQLEAEVLLFYEQHKAYLDLFTVGLAVKTHRQRMLSRLQNAISENLGMIMTEIRNSAELGELLFRASKGEKLNKQDRRRMGKQLVDILRTIPSLAIFSLPGGALLLPLLYKVLPNSMKPRAFAERARKKKAQGDQEGM